MIEERYTHESRLSNVDRPQASGTRQRADSLGQSFHRQSGTQIKFLPPALGLNDRRYYEYFGTSRFDWIYYAILKKVLPCYVFTEEEYIATGEKDFARAIRVYAEKKGLDKKDSYALLTEGLWGNWYSVRKARHFVLSQLYRTKHLTDNLYQLDKADRRQATTRRPAHSHGRFFARNRATEYQGLWNTRVPLAWYVNICRQLSAAFGDNVTFMLLTDGTEAELHDFVAEFQPITNFGQPYCRRQRSARTCHSGRARLFDLVIQHVGRDAFRRAIFLVLAESSR